MINGQKVLAIIPARGGSKTLPRKNIRCLAGKPLIAWTIEEARKSQYIDCSIISSDDDEIIRVAREWGAEVPFIRPAELAEDDTPGIEPVLHALKSINGYYDYTVLLQPTSPLRTVKDIDECIHYCISKGAVTCTSVSKVDKSPYWMYSLNDQQRLRPLVLSQQSINRRQDLPPIYALNGAIYVAQTQYLQKARCFISHETLAYIMPAERAMDIDDEIDFRYCELKLQV